MLSERMADIKYEVELNSSNLSSTITIPHVFERYSEDQLYGTYRPVITLFNKYVTPVWYVIGFPSNGLSFIIWLQPRMRPSSGCYLTALALADFIFLILQLCYELQSTWNIRLLTYPVICQGFPVFFYASQYLSPLLVLGFTVERYISICHPFKREKFCSTSRAIKVIAMLILISLLLHAIQGYFWIYANNDCILRPSVTLGGTSSLWSVWSWITELLVFGLVPLSILFLNILVIKETRYLSKTEETRLCLRGGHKSSAATVTLLAVSFYLICTTLPVTICYALFSNFPEGDPYLTNKEMHSEPTWQRHFNYVSVRTIVQELGMSHYACNFFIYLTTGKLFRKELKTLIFGAFCKRKLETLRRKEQSEMSESYRAITCAFARVSITSKKTENGDVTHL